MSTAPLRLTGHGLTPADIAAVARQRRPVAIDAAALARMAAARGVVERHLAEDRPVYGLTTGLGPRATQRLPAETLAEFSRLTLRGRAQSVGPRFAPDIVRAMMLVRVNGLLAGGAGAQPATAETLVAMLNAGIHPLVPSIGSTGASDLCVFAHVGLAVIGEGEVARDGGSEPAADALSRDGLAPVAIGPKDGLALCSSNAPTAGHGALALHDAGELLQLAELAAALSLEGFRANLSPFDPRIAAARPQPGQAEAARRLLALLAGGGLTEPGAARRVQDPLSYRCIPQVHGSLLAALEFAGRALDAELNGAGDNPLVVIDNDAILSNGNFHTPALALGFDALGLAVSQVANLTFMRCQRMLSDRFTDLPSTLTPKGPTRYGMGPLSKVPEALAAEIRQLANPVSVDSRSAADGVEDDSTNAPLAVRKLADMLPRWRLMIAVELLMAAQAVELRGDIRLGRGTAIAQRAVRALAPSLEDDRPLFAEVERIADVALASGRLLSELRPVLEGA